MRFDREEADAVCAHPMRSVILRAGGLEETIRPGISTFPARVADVLLLCSDGLSASLAPSELERLVRSEADLAHLVEQLADSARDAGSGDDVTVVAARLG